MLSRNLKRLRKERGMTLEELAARVGTSRQTVHRYENGIISNVPSERVERLAEALEVTPSQLMGWEDEGAREPDVAVPVSAKRLPILGEISCGKPIYASEEHESYVTSSGEFDADFCLRAHGDSMVGARIYDGDLVFIRSQQMVENGEIAAVVINDEATLKRVYYYPNEGKLVLSPENPKYAPLVYIRDELETITILGKAVAFQSTCL